MVPSPSFELFRIGTEEQNSATCSNAHTAEGKCVTAKPKNRCHFGTGYRYGLALNARIAAAKLAEAKQLAIGRFSQIVVPP
jgi:hypothetical protein